MKREEVWVLHPNFRQCGPVTGRMSCSDPNLLTVASETTGRTFTKTRPKPRPAFGPRPGHMWLLPDYSQMEVWLFALLSQEKRMVDILMGGHDFHGTMAKKTWGAEPDFLEKKDFYRKRGKLVMFCKLYGGGPAKLAALLGCDVGEAASFVHAFDARLPEAVAFMRRMEKQAKEAGHIRNMFGRVYYLEPEFAYRAVNYIIQGTAADILKNSLIRIDRMLRGKYRKWNTCALLLPIHDEIVLEAPVELANRASFQRAVIRCMQGDWKQLGFPCPIPVDMKIATSSWHDTEKVDLPK